MNRGRPRKPEAELKDVRVSTYVPMALLKRIDQKIREGKTESRSQFLRNLLDDVFDESKPHDGPHLPGAI